MGFTILGLFYFVIFLWSYDAVMTLIHAFFLCVLIDIKKIQMSARDHFQRIFSDHEKLKLQLETQKIGLETRIEEMEKRAVANESESRKLADEIEKVC